MMSNLFNEHKRKLVYYQVYVDTWLIAGHDEVIIACPGVDRQHDVNMLIIDLNMQFRARLFVETNVISISEITQHIDRSARRLVK